jgi:hypothetical protein
MVAVGMRVAPHPPHRSRRALLTHRAPASGRDVPAQVRIRLYDAGPGEPAVDEAVHSFPIELMALAATKQRFIPKTAHLVAECLQFPCVARYPIVAVMPEQHHTQPLPHSRHRMMQTSFELCFKLHQFRPNPLVNAMTENRIFAISGLPTYVSKTKKIKCFRLSFTPSLAVLDCKPPKLNKPRLALMEFQIELPKTLPKLSQEPLRVLPVLETNHEVIAEPDHDDIARGVPGPPLDSPQIEHIVQIDVGKQGTDASSLRHAIFTTCPCTLLKHACVKPLLYVPQDALVRNTVLDELHQPFVVDGAKVTTDVCIKHPAYPFRHDSPIKGIQGIMWTAPRAEPVRKSEKVRLIDPVQHFHHRALDNFVFQRSDSQWPLSAIGFGNVRSLDRLCSIRPAFQPRRKIPEILLQVLRVVPPCLTVHPRRCIALEAEVTLPEMLDVVDVVPERGKLQPFIATRCLSYPFHRVWQVLRASLHGLPFPGAEPRTCFAGTDSPWPGPFPPQSPPAGISPTLVRLLPRYIWACPTSHVRPSPSCSLGIRGADRSAIRHGQTRDLPVPARKASMRAQGLRPRGAGTSLAISTCSVLPSDQVDVVGTPKQTLFRGSIPGPHFPLSTLRLVPCDSKRMTRGRCDSLDLHRVKLSFTTFRRSSRRTNYGVKTSALVRVPGATPA